ncbi:hypothetical protein ACIQXR_05405 [Peribacillus sp. NPDC097224]|uniref:hypothetical protein n=1 Tax=Peribacillus sp. NPDC097224 TaxID=3364399 RepID=UPI00381E848C
MGKKKAIKLATATAIAASAFVAVAPTQSEAATSSVDKAITKATKQMAKAYDTYHKSAKNGELPATGTIRNQTALAKDYYDKAKAEIAKNGGSKAKKTAYTKQLDGKKYFLDRAQAYVNAVNTNLKPAQTNFTKAVEAGKAKQVLVAQTVLNKDIASFEGKVAKIYGPDARNLLLKKYAAPAQKLADSVNDEMKVYNAYKQIENGFLIEKDVKKAGELIESVKAEVTKLKAKNTKLAKSLLAAVEKNNAAYEKANSPAVSKITAVNATTVELTYKEKMKDVEAKDFSIEGLTVTNAVVKQTDDKTVILTTSTQEGGKEYTVKSGEEKLGLFKGISAVIPTAVKVTTPSIQGTIGKEVTVKATVTVPEGQSKAGIPVTINIPSTNSLNPVITDEVYTNANGEAVYSYTRYSAINDNVIVYATGDRSKSSTAKVYFVESLAVSEITAGNTLPNNTKKSYKVTGDALTSYYVAIKENNNVTPDKVNKVDVLDRYGNWKTPYSLTTGDVSYVEIFTDKDGEATFTVTGADTSVTPVVYEATASNKKYAATDLQVAAPTVTFSLQNALQLAVKAEGEQYSAQYSVNPLGKDPETTGLGGRDYTVTVTDKNGKLATEGTIAHVFFETGNIKNADKVFVVSGKNIYASTAVVPVIVGKDGKASFRVLGDGVDTFAKPTVFLNTAGSTTTPVLDKTDVQTVAETTYFTAAKVKNAVLTVSKASTTVNTDATITYQSQDQNGFPYSPGPAYDLTFDVTSTFGDVTVKDVNGDVLEVTQNLGTTKTYKVKADVTGKAVIKVNSASQDTVSVNVSGANGILPLKAATVQFAGQASTLDRINAATTKAEILAALEASNLTPAFIKATNKPAIVDHILEKRPAGGYTQTVFETEYKTVYRTTGTTGRVTVSDATNKITLEDADLTGTTAQVKATGTGGIKTITLNRVAAGKYESKETALTDLALNVDYTITYVDELNSSGATVNITGNKTLKVTPLERTDVDAPTIKGNPTVTAGVVTVGLTEGLHFIYNDAVTPLVPGVGTSVPYKEAFKVVGTDNLTANIIKQAEYFAPTAPTTSDAKFVITFDDSKAALLASKTFTVEFDLPASWLPLTDAAGNNFNSTAKYEVKFNSVGEAVEITKK